MSSDNRVHIMDECEGASGFAGAAATAQDDGSDVSGLATAVHAMCGGFGQQNRRQRTLSWVSSTRSSNDAPLLPTGATPGLHGEGQLEPPDASIHAIGTRREPGVASGRQHVRLTTIDPVTGNIIEMARMSGLDQQLTEGIAAADGLCDARPAAGLGPGYIKKVFIKPDILHVAIPVSSDPGRFHS
ncbi:hypothetical protein GGF46_004756 [Coemansia sp. RSA 552]|nr:hypothetical protein GGF46_004756 [Coemansia sp. RSA 552]